MSQDFVHKFSNYLSDNSLNLDNDTVLLLSEYYTLSDKWGRVINITNNLSLDKFCVENLLDPIASFFSFCDTYPIDKVFSNRSPLRFIDLGCGGGYVGLVWHILSQGKFQSVVLDGDRKKINFCKQVIRELGLIDITAVQSRVEDYKSALPFDLIVSRATWEPLEFLRQSAALSNFESFRVHFSSENQKRELESTELQSQLFHENFLPYQLLPAGFQRYLSVFSSTELQK